jgi:hypothetical protein
MIFTGRVLMGIVICNLASEVYGGKLMPTLAAVIIFLLGAQLFESGIIKKMKENE